MRSLIAVAAIAFALNTSASTSTSEITDMWWDPTKSGEGFNVILQNDVAFVTFFVYDQTMTPFWYTAELRYQGNLVWFGPLYATTGPWFGGPFNPALVTRRQAGTANFTLVDLAHATFSFAADGVPVTLNLQRQTWTNENYTGTYAGGYSIRFSSCGPSSLNGVQDALGTLAVNQVGNSVSMDSTTPTGTCSFGGTYSQTGKLGDVQGTYSCSDGTRGTFEAFEMTPTISGFNARIAGQDQFCQWAGYLGGIRRAE